MPSWAFGSLFRLKKLTIASFNRITIRSNGFTFLDHLKTLTLRTDIQLIESKGFKFDEPTPKMAIIF